MVLNLTEFFLLRPTVTSTRENVAGDALKTQWDISVMDFRSTLLLPNF